MLFNLASSFFLLLHLCVSQTSGTQTFWPVAVPLAVRSPYLNAWMYALNTSTNNWPAFWSSQTLGWICYIRVDGKTYTLFGNNNLPSTYPVNSSILIDTRVTPTQTIQTMQAGLMNVTVTFLNPITPSDWLQQSLPFSYLAVNFTSADGQQHNVQLYSDITGEWLSGNRNMEMTWSTPTNTGSMIYQQLQLAQPAQWQESDDQAMDGTAFFAMPLGQGRNVTWQTCQDVVCREEFVTAGGVDSNNNNATFRVITDDWPVFPISVDLGEVASLESPVVWVIGYVRDPSIEYTLSGQTAQLRPYFTTVYSTLEDALNSTVSGFEYSLTQAAQLDSQIFQAALNISSDGKYFNMLSLATRQAFASLDITAPFGPGQSETRMFMKDMGSSRRVTPVENLYAALPMFLYLNASLVKPLLLPLLESQNSSQTTFPCASRDLSSGAYYPIASGPTLVIDEGVEQSGNMLIMLLAHARFTNDTSLIQGYYTLLKTWADYLIDNALYTTGQLSIDTGNISPNSSNLAIKGIIGIQAMAEISSFLGNTNDSKTYGSAAATQVAEWKQQAFWTGGTYIVWEYGDVPSLTWTLPYNLYGQTMLGLDLVNETELMRLTDSYISLLQPSFGYTYGLPITSINNSPANTAWNAFTAATFTNMTACAVMLDQLWNYASFNSTAGPFGSVFNAETGSYVNGSSSPAQGGLFAPLLLSRINSSQTTQPSPSSTGGSVPSSVRSGSKAIDGAIAGGVVGGVLGLALLIITILYLRRRANRIAKADAQTTAMLQPAPFDVSGRPEHEMSHSVHNTSAMASGKRRPITLAAEDAALQPAPQSSTAPSTQPSSRTQLSSPRADGSRSQQEELMGLRSDIRDLRRVIMGATVESPSAAAEAPPGYE